MSGVLLLTVQDGRARRDSAAALLVPAPRCRRSARNARILDHGDRGPLEGGAGVWAHVAATYVSGFVQIVASWVASRFRPNFGLASFTMWRELAGYGRHVLAGTLIDHVALAVNTLLLGRFRTPAALGQYRYAARLAFVPQQTRDHGRFVRAAASTRAWSRRSASGSSAACAVRSSCCSQPSFRPACCSCRLGIPLAVLLLGEHVAACRHGPRYLLLARAHPGRWAGRR